MFFGRLFGRRASPSTEDGRRWRAQRLAQAALELYGLHDAQEVELLRHEFVQVFRVRSASRGEFALRLYRLPEPPKGLTAAAMRSPRVLHSQLLWLSALSEDTGLLVPEPLRTLDGELVGQVRVEGTPWRRQSALVKWVPGVHKREALTEADSLRVGSFLAKMHGHAEGYVVPEGSEFPSWDWRWAFGEAGHVWNKGSKFYSEEEMETFRQTAGRIRHHLNELGEGRDVFGLIHRDLNPNNVVFSSQGVGVIDFDLCGLGYYLFDLTTFRRSLNTQPADRRELLWEAFLRGYENVRPFPERIRARLELYLDTLNALHRVAMVNRRLAMLSSVAIEPEAREELMHFLKASPRWLRRQVQRMSGF